MLIIWVIWTFGASTPFSECINKHKRYHAYANIDNASFYFVRAFIRAQLNSACAAHVANHFNGAIAALSGVAVAIFTATLWWVTWGMVGLAREQRIDLLKSIDAAVRSAEAAEKAAHVERAWVYFKDTNFGEAPNTFVNGIPVGDRFVIYINWINGGRTPAVKVSTTSDFKIVQRPNAGEELNIPIFLPNIDIADGITGQNMATSSRPIILTPTEYSQAKLADTELLIVYARIDYFDVFNPAERRTSEVTALASFSIVEHEGKRRDAITLSFIGAQNRCT